VCVKDTKQTNITHQYYRYGSTLSTSSRVRNSLLVAERGISLRYCCDLGIWDTRYTVKCTVLVQYEVHVLSSAISVPVPVRTVQSSNASVGAVIPVPVRSIPKHHTSTSYRTTHYFSTGTSTGTYSTVFQCFCRCRNTGTGKEYSKTSYEYFVPYNALF
jgi:hypothetical protein